MNWLLVAVGSALGGMGRYGCVGLVDARFESTFPWGTLAVNLIGSAAIGWLAAVAEHLELGDGARLFLMVGVLGGFTTFSAFSLQALTLLRTGAPLAAFAYIAATLLLCLLGVWLGHSLGGGARLA